MNNIYQTTQFLPNGDFSNFYSIEPPKINNAGAVLLLMVGRLMVHKVGDEAAGLSETTITLMGNAQTVNFTECPVSEFLDSMKLNSDDYSDIYNIILKRLALLNGDSADNTVSDNE